MMRPVMILHLGADTWMPYSLARLMINEQQIDAIVDYAHCPWLLRLPRLSRLERSQNFKGDCQSKSFYGAENSALHVPIYSKRKCDNLPTARRLPVRNRIG